VAGGLKERGHDVDDLDLYSEQFEPVLTLLEREAYYRAGTNFTGVDKCVERLRAAEALVPCFPTWWCGMPAILNPHSPD
jgi:putative NADPH-quinone reductase